MKLRFTRRSRRHLKAIAEYIAEHDAGASRRVGERIREVVTLIGKFPLIGRGGMLADTREMVVPGLPYVIVYRVEEDSVTILGIYHGAQLRPGQERPRGGSR